MPATAVLGCPAGQIHRIWWPSTQEAGQLAVRPGLRRDRLASTSRGWPTAGACPSGDPIYRPYEYRAQHRSLPQTSRHAGAAGHDLSPSGRPHLLRSQPPRYLGSCPSAIVPVRRSRSSRAGRSRAASRSTLTPVSCRRWNFSGRALPDMATNARRQGRRLNDRTAKPVPPRQISIPASTACMYQLRLSRCWCRE